jgi:hypothetical protein
VSHRLSFSRLLPCVWWARPDVDCPDDPPGEKAQIGTCTHGLGDEHLTGRPFDRTKHTPRVVAEALSIFNGPLKSWLDTWKAQPGEKIVEGRLRYDTETGRAFPTPRRGEDGYTRPSETQLTGEIDLVTIYPDESLAEIVDLKTGQKRNSNESQLRGYSVVVKARYGVKRVRSSFLYARKTKLDLEPWIEMDEDDLDAEAGKLRRTLRTLPQASPMKGDHCYRCPLGQKRFTTCPKWQVDERYIPDPATEARLYDDETHLAF